MKISVIVPVYNCASYVERCVRSIMAQTHADLEIICVNDGSSDDSGKILDALAGEDARIRVIHQQNAGVSAARNRGLDIATGELITFVDGDDAIEPDMYETLLPYFDDPDVDIVHCGYKRIGLNGSVKDVNGTGKLEIQNRYEAAQCLLGGRLFVGSLWNKLYRVHLFDRMRMDTTLSINEDVLANAELFAVAKKLVYFDVSKYLFYERKGSATNITKHLKKLEDSAAAAEKMLQLFTGTPAQKAAEERLLFSRIGLYRWYVMYSLKDSKAIRRSLAEKIDAAMKVIPISRKQKLNYRMLKYVPRFYKTAYAVYDRIRVPNWDVNSEE